MPAVIFDMDGVLVDSGPPHAESWRILARRDGIEIDDAQFQQLFGRRSADIIRTLWGPTTSDSMVAAYDAEKEAVYRDLVRQNVPIMPGCLDLLERLRTAGLALAVGTSGPPENLMLVLEAGGLDRYFQATVHGYDVVHGKPAPDVFLLAARRLGMPPKACVVVEDAPVGIRAATAAGMPSIGLTGTHPADRLREAGANRVVHELSAITTTVIEDVLSTGHTP
ncbi:MAG: HAD family phosphatase [Phycisphaerales bacterium]|nr:HAD family phosphatase [Phycisphaerales bacterium]